MNEDTHQPASGIQVPPIVLAPLQGVTTATFRRVLARHFGGFDRAMAPFIPTMGGGRTRGRHFKDILPEANRDAMPLIPQLIGRDGHDFRETANRIHDSCAVPVYVETEL